MKTHIVLFNNNLYEVGAVRLSNNKLYLSTVVSTVQKNIYALIANIIYSRFNIHINDITVWFCFYHQKDVFIVVSTNFDMILNTTEQSPPNIRDVGWTSPCSLAVNDEIVICAQQQLKKLLWNGFGRCVDVLHLRYLSSSTDVAQSTDVTHMYDIVKDYVRDCEHRDNNTVVLLLTWTYSHGVAYGEYAVI